MASDELFPRNSANSGGKGRNGFVEYRIAKRESPLAGRPPQVEMEGLLVKDPATEIRKSSLRSPTESLRFLIPGQIARDMDDQDPVDGMVRKKPLQLQLHPATAGR